MKYLFALLLVGCASQDLAKRNLTNVKAIAPVVPNPVLVDQSVATAEELAEATGPVEQVIHMGIPAELAQENVNNVHALVAAIPADVQNPAPSAVRVAEDLAGEVATTNTIAAVTNAAGATQPWWIPVTAIIGSLGAAFTTLKTARRIKKKVEAVPPAAAKPATVA
jgi:hypothetical protein